MSYWKSVFNWFKRADPEIGSRWLFKHSSPFDTDSVIEIVAVKDGWVQHKYVAHPTWKLDSTRISLLSFLYRQV